MKYFKKSLLIVLIAFFGFALLFGITEGFYYLFIFPILVLTVFLGSYLIKQYHKDKEENLKKGFKYTAEDMEAEKWIQDTLAPSTLSYIKTKHWTIIVYSFVFVIFVSFLWSYLTGGMSEALRNLLYAVLLFWFFVLYVFTAPMGYDYVYNHLPKTMKQKLRGDWLRGYLFLLPVTFLLYLLSPFGNSSDELLARLLSFPVFFLIYTFSFVCLYCIIYLQNEAKKEEEKELKKSVKEMLEDD